MYDVLHYILKIIKTNVNRFLIDILLDSGSEVKIAKDLLIDYNDGESLLLKKDKRVVISSNYPVSGIWKVNNQITSVLSVEFNGKTALVSKDYIRPLGLIDIIKDFNLSTN